MFQKIRSFLNGGKKQKQNKEPAQKEGKVSEKVEEKLEKKQIQEPEIEEKKNPQWITIKKEIPQEVRREIIKKMDSVSPNFCWDNWSKQGISILCEYIEDWKCSQITGSYNKSSNILKDIQYINFDFLNTLYLSNCNIESIEAFGNAHFPRVSVFSLDNNRIITMKSFRKCKMDSLTFLTLNQNYFKNGEQMTKSLPASFQSLDLEGINDFQCCPEVRWLAKLKAQNLKRVSICTSRRIKMRYVPRVLERKYKEVKVHVHLEDHEIEPDNIMRFTMDM